MGLFVVISFGKIFFFSVLASSDTHANPSRMKSSFSTSVDTIQGPSHCLRLGQAVEQRPHQGRHIRYKRADLECPAA